MPRERRYAVIGKRKKIKYSSELPRRMYSFFIGYDEGGGAPSFAKFARLSGLCTADIERFREHKEFERAYLECREIRRDYLVDRALSRRFDAGMVKFLLTDEVEAENTAVDEGISVKIEVTE